MLLLILIVAAVLFASLAAGIILVQSYKISKGKIVVDEEYNGPEEVSVTVHTILRFMLKRSVHLRRFCMQYFFHILVRLMYYFDMLTSKMYAKSRNWFVKNAVRNKGTVPHFWEHLKVYKQEIDKEKERRSTDR